MRRSVLPSLGLLFLLALMAIPQAAKPHRHQVVFEMNSPGPDAWDQAIGNMENIRKAFAPEPVDFEVVCFGNGLSLLLKTNSAFAGRLETLAGTGVKLVACQNSMRKRRVSTEDLFTFAGQVDSGAAEVIRKQEQGWSYLKSGE